jgi:hypothetical protein
MRSTNLLLTFVLSIATLAAAVAVSPDGATILYRVAYGAESGTGGHDVSGVAAFSAAVATA